MKTHRMPGGRGEAEAERAVSLGELPELDETFEDRRLARETAQALQASAADLRRAIRNLEGKPSK